MILLGKIDKRICKTAIKPAFMNYKDIDYDLSPAKQVILDFLMTTQHDIPDHISNYKLNKLDNKSFRFQIKNNDNLSFIICVNTGKIYMTY
jgi:hypothetical protein